jgi:hypothetical protein
VTCSACGARNSPSSAWCTQCFAPLGATPPPPAELTTQAARTVAAAAAPDVRQVGEDVEWRCGRCGRWTALGRADCATCGGARTGFGAEVDRRTRALPAGVGLAVSAVLPGVAHLLAGRVGSGVARLALTIGWGAAAVTAWGPDRAPSSVAWAFLVGVVLVWLGTLVDSTRLDRPTGPELLRSRVLLVLVAGVTVAAVLAVLVDALG